MPHETFTGAAFGAAMSSSIGAAMDSLWRRAIAVLGIFYGVGLIIVNAELASWGIVNLELARAQYVLAGALWAFVCLPFPPYGAGLLSVSLRARRLRWLHPTVRRILRICLFGIFIPLMTINMVAGYPAGKGPFYHALDPFVILGVVVNCASLVIGVFYVNRIRAALQSDSGHRGSQWMLVPSGLLLGATILGVNLTVYATQLYSVMPQHFGGGNRPAVMILMSAPYPANSGLPISDDGRTIWRTFLLLETSNTVVVTGFERVQTNRARYRANAVAINRNQISSLVYLREE
jgi:hypothetical protein